MKMPGFIDAAAQIWLAGCHCLHIAVNGSGYEFDPRRYPGRRSSLAGSFRENHTVERLKQAINQLSFDHGPFRLGQIRRTNASGFEVNPCLCGSLVRRAALTGIAGGKSAEHRGKGECECDYIGECTHGVLLLLSFINAAKRGQIRSPGLTVAQKSAGCGDRHPASTLPGPRQVWTAESPPRPLGIVYGVLFLTNGLQASYRQPKGPQFAIYGASGLTQYHWPFKYNLVRSHRLTTCHR